MRTGLIALVTALVGGVLGVILGEPLTRALGVTTFEGARGYAVVFLVIPACILLGVIVAIITAKTMGADAAWWRVQGLAVLITAAIAGGITAFFVMTEPKPPTLGGSSLDLEFEIRMPEGREAPDTATYGGFSAVMVSNNRRKQAESATLDHANVRTEDGRVIVPGTFRLVESTRNRSMAINDPPNGYWFDLPLAAKPTDADREWSEWFPAPGQQASTDVRGTAGFQVRWRVREATP